MTSHLENILPLEEVSEPLAQSLEIWRQLAGARPMPSRKDLDPIQLAKILRSIEILSILRNQAGDIIDFKYDLIGSNIDDHAQERRVNQKLSEIPHQNQTTNIFKSILHAANSQQPLALRMDYVGSDVRVSHAEGIIMPLGDKKDNTNSILFAVNFVFKDYFQ